MKVKFLKHEPDDSYSKFKPSRAQPFTRHHGKTYTLIGSSVKTYNGRDRLILAIECLAKTLGSLGIALASKDFREDWKAAIWSGKRTVQLYGSEFLANKVLANSGDVKAAIRLGEMYEKGYDVPQDLTKSINYYKIAANKGDANALFALGKLYASTIPHDYKLAAEFYDKASRQDHIEATKSLADLYKKGLGVERDLQKATKLTAKAYELKASSKD